MTETTKRVPVSEYPCADGARWACSEWRGRVGLSLLVETAAHLRHSIEARRYMDADAMWHPTGERVRVYPDGTVERIDAGGEP